MPGQFHHQLRTCEHDCESYERQCGAQKQRCDAASWREVIKRRHLEEEALVDGRRRDLDGAMDPTVPKDHEGTRRTDRI